MAPTIQTVGELTSTGIKVLAHGYSGAGKTYAIASLQNNPLILSTEYGLLSLKHIAPQYHCLVVRTYKEFSDMLDWAIGSAEANVYGCICIDGLTDIADVLLTEEKAKNKHALKAYGEMGDTIIPLLWKIQAASRDFYMTARSGLVDVADGLAKLGPVFPGKALSPQVPFVFDEIFQLLPAEQPDPVTGKKPRWFRTEDDRLVTAKDRSGVLDPWEPADLNAIFTKIRGGA